MRRASMKAFPLIACFVALQAASAGGLPPFHYLNETATRLVADPLLGVLDFEEKDYAWGDLDQDGDIDLVVVRKQPFTTPGRRPNVLFMNVSGVLTDQTARYASTAINVPEPDEGFLTPTNDRDVIVIDVNGDGWLDVVTAVTMSDGLPKHIGHPRVYVNQGLVGGTWGGLVFDNARIPAMATSPIDLAGAPQEVVTGFNPRFCAVAGGDLTGDGRPELYFGDYDSSGTPSFIEPPGVDFNQKLLLNNGDGYFTDCTLACITAMASPGTGTFPAWQSAFGAAAAIVDMNSDGFNDIVYQTGHTIPQYVGILYNTPLAPDASDGFSTNAQIAFPTSSSAAYFISAADLNNDGRLDLIETDDFVDKYLLSTGISNGGAEFSAPFAFPGATNGFGSQNIGVDLNGDEWSDILIADVDVDLPGCTRTADIMLNNANPPNVTFAVNSGGIPNSMLTGVFHFAVFDVNGDGWNDIVVGRCSGTQVWIFDAPTPVLVGDLDGNGVVNSLDLGILLSSWSIPATAPGCGGSLPCAADLNADGFVNSLDLGMLLSNWTL